MVYGITHNRTAILIFVLCLGSFCFSKPATSSENMETAGDVVLVLIPSIAHGITFYLDDPEGRIQFYKSFFTNMGVTYALKLTTNRERPDGGNHSFPSGHTSISFQSAAFIHKRYGRQYGFPAYLGASFVGCSRVEANKHYITDVLAGAASGIISSFYFTRPHRGVTVTPVVNKDYYAISMTKKW